LKNNLAICTNLIIKINVDLSCHANALLEDFDPFSDTNYVHGYMVIILILANFYVITISFHLKSGPSYEIFTQQKFGAIWHRLRVKGVDSYMAMKIRKDLGKSIIHNYLGI